jgi:ring-1,2-phenylacetyl-CoA epoxidase subunit PaaD
MVNTQTRDAVWAALGEVPDPEVPAISIVELGIVRDVAWTGERWRVAVTPTYSGCPATEMITTMIRERLADIGLTDIDIEQRLSPPWTTDWLAPEARSKLAGFGIAPPHILGGRIDVAGISPLRRTGVVVPCPRCGSQHTSLLSQFGSTACKAQYRCDECREPFDYFKPH